MVLGVGRSGTSAFARVLSLLGASLPRDVLGADPGNERGHWEPRRIIILNNEVLALHGSDWYDSRAFPRSWFESQEAKTFIQRAAELISEEYGGDPFIVIKEPRISRLAPVYLAALEQLGYAPRVVVPLRHPGEIIGSLKRRDGADTRSSELIWIRHSLEAEEATRRCPRVWVTYDQLLKDWWTVQARISAELDIQWPVPPDRAAEAIAAFLEPALRHFDAGIDDLTEAVGPVATQLWRAEQAGVAGDEPSLQAGFDAIRTVLNELDRLSAARAEADEAAAAAESAAFRAALAAQEAEFQRRRDELEKAAGDAQQNLLAAKQVLLSVNQDTLTADQNLATRTNELLQSRHELSKLTEVLAAQDATLNELRARLAERDQAMNAVVRSRSWQVTQPLRWVSGAFRQLVGF